MLNTNFARGVAMMGAALFFGYGATRYPIGDFARAGPGMFPLLVSSILFALAALSIVQSRLREAVPLTFNLRNIALILVSLILFVLASKYVSMILGIVILVFVSGTAANTYSIKRNAQITACLTLIAFVFEKGLGLQLGLL